MSVSDSGSALPSAGDGQEKALALRLAQARAKAEAARLEAEALALEAELAIQQAASAKEISQPAAAKTSQPRGEKTGEKTNGKKLNGRASSSKPASSPTKSKLNKKPSAKQPSSETPKPQPKPKPQVKSKPPAAVPTTPKSSDEKPPASKPAVKEEKPQRPPGRPLTKPAARNTAAVGGAASAGLAEIKSGGTSPSQQTTKSIPPKQLATADATAEAEAADDEAAEEHDDYSTSIAMKAVPGWLISMIVHTVGLLVMALVTFTNPDIREEVFSMANPVEEEVEELEEIEQIDPMEELEIEDIPDFQATEIQDEGIAAFGDLAVQAETEVSDVGEINTSEIAMVEIGQLFGDEGEGFADTNEGSGGAQFFGVASSGRKFVFLVDSSKSMNNGKFEAALQELASAISRLKPDQYFYVSFFDHDDLPMFDKENPEPRPLPVTPENLQRLYRWLPTVELELKTTPYASVKRAMEMNPDAIYLLTDGQFRDKTEAYLKKHNTIDDPAADYPFKTRFHTIGFYSDQGRPLLEKLAKDNGGSYRFVPDPRKRK